MCSLSVFCSLARVSWDIWDQQNHWFWLMTHSKHTYVESRKQWSHKGWGHISSLLCFCFLSLVGIWDPATTHPHITPLKRDRNFFSFSSSEKTAHTNENFFSACHIHRRPSYLSDVNMYPSLVNDFHQIGLVSRRERCCKSVVNFTWKVEW